MLYDPGSNTLSAAPNCSNLVYLAIRTVWQWVKKRVCEAACARAEPRRSRKDESKGKARVECCHRRQRWHRRRRTKQGLKKIEFEDTFVWWSSWLRRSSSVSAESLIVFYERRSALFRDLAGGRHGTVRRGGLPRHDPPCIFWTVYNQSQLELEENVRNFVPVGLKSTIRHI